MFWRKRKPQNNLESYMKNHLFAFWVLMMQPYLLFFNEKKECDAKPHDFLRILSLEVVSMPKNQAGLSVYSNSYKLTKISCSIALWTKKERSRGAVISEVSVTSQFSGQS